MRNGKALASVLAALAALAVLVGAAVAARLLDRVGLREAVAAVPLGGVLALLSLWLARRAREENARTLTGVSASGRVLTATGRGLGAVALLIAVTAALAVVVFAVLLLVLE